MDSVTVQGTAIPRLGLGTAGMTGTECRRAVLAGLDYGYRHIDTAQMYDNEDAIGKALTRTSVSRDDMFLVTKILRENLGYDSLLQSFEASLDRLQTNYVDLLLIHAPSRTVPIEESIGAMNELQHEGLVKHIGVSNFSIEELEDAIAASESPIVTNQIEYNPFHEQPDRLAFCLANDIALTAYSPLARGKVVENETLKSIGARYDKSAAQVALRWLLQQEKVVVIPKAADEDHLEENLAVFDFALTNDEMEAIFDLQGGLVDRVRSLIGL